MPPAPPKIFIAAADSAEAQAAAANVRSRMDVTADCGAADIILVLGGDGTMLEALHAYGGHGKPYYGINFGSIGFLMNPEAAIETLAETLEAARPVTIYPLSMRCTCEDGAGYEAMAFNEVALFRQTRQAAKLKISVDGKERIGELICDGVLLATPAGSTAYNLSAHGPILPLSANVLALTPISAFRPRRWRGALLPCDEQVEIEVLEAAKRPVSLTADSAEFRRVQSVTIRQSSENPRTLLFDPDHALEERISREQFTV